MVSGKCVAQAERVGDQTYAATLAREAKEDRSVKSELMRSLNALIKALSFVIVPLGLLLFYSQYWFVAVSGTLRDSVVSTVAAMVGMIPDGLVLLTSVALAVGVVRLAKRRTLVQSLYSMEDLARVDVLCLDKTGTLTSGNLSFERLELMDPATKPLALARAGRDAAGGGRLGRHVQGADAPLPRPEGCKNRPRGAVLVGAQVVGRGGGRLRRGAGRAAVRAAGRGRGVQGEGRVPRVGGAQGAGAGEIPSPAAGGRAAPGLKPLALVLLSDEIRPEAPDTLAFFEREGVEIKVISGDDPVTVSAVAARAGVKNADRFVDASTLKTDDAVVGAASKYTVFGRVTPQQKRLLVKALKAAGHTVAMTGDGVNDIPALKEADCSIAMASGSDASRQVASLVLLDCNFASMPEVVMEGRQGDQ